MPQKEDSKVHRLKKKKRELKKVLLVASDGLDLLSAYIWITMF